MLTFWHPCCHLPPNQSDLDSLAGFNGSLSLCDSSCPCMPQASDQSWPSLVFCIGGPFGHSPAVRARGNETIRLSKMVLNHQARRLFKPCKPLVMAVRLQSLGGQGQLPLPAPRQCIADLRCPAKLLLAGGACGPSRAAVQVRRAAGQCEAAQKPGVAVPSRRGVLHWCICNTFPDAD